MYGDFAVKLTQRIALGGSLDIVDVVAAQLENLRRKLPRLAPVRLIQNDSTNLNLADESYDQAVMFFLLHELPADAREKTLSEALRVLKPGGKLMIVDYHKPSVWHPLRYLFQPVLRMLEPFAMDLWNKPVKSWFPEHFVPSSLTQETYFGRLYQKVVVVK